LIATLNFYTSIVMFQSEILIISFDSKLWWSLKLRRGGGKGWKGGQGGEITQTMYAHVNK
jgi:hypothetical protein